MAAGKETSGSRTAGPRRSGTTGRSGGNRSARLDARSVASLLAAATRADDRICVASGPEGALRRLLVARLMADPPQGATILRISATGAMAADAIRGSTQPSLFGGETWLLVSDLDQGGEDVLSAAKEALAAAGEDLRIVLEHGGSARGRGVVNAAEKAGAAMFEARPVAAAALPAVLTTHASGHGRRLTSEAAAGIIDATGQDLAALLAVVEQLASDSPDEVIDLGLVRSTLTSVGSEDQFAIADLVWRRRTEPALEAFRRLVERNGASSACVTVVAALSYTLRSLAKYVADRPSGSQWQIAAALGVPAWKIDALAAQASLWGPGQLAQAAVVLADADADVKGGLGDAGALDPEQKLFAVERVILRLGAA